MGMLGWVIPCQYMQFGPRACMFRISHGFQCRQDRRYIADSTTQSLIKGIDDIQILICVYMQLYLFFLKIISSMNAPSSFIEESLSKLNAIQTSDFPQRFPKL
jgi:hypothetical protein